MCGICGIYLRDGEVDKTLLKKMTNALESRGPDDSGFFVDRGIGLGMRRLSVIDLVTGSQPIHNEDQSIQVIFNGEIYNFNELRNNLEGKHKFYTDSDTEVLVHLYEEYGENLVEYLNGMFSFAIWDSNKEILLLARDRLGIKPLYYYKDDDKFIFASEIKSIIKDPEIERKIDFEALNYCMGFEYIPAPYTIFDGIKKLEPGHLLSVGQHRINKRRYWDVKYSPQKKDTEFFVHNIKRLLTDSVGCRLISDVPLGVFLSGGLDSSFIVALMSEISKEPVKTFSIGFEDQSYNELMYARMVSEKFDTIHHEKILDPDIVKIIETITSYLDEPFADSSAIPTYLISKMTRENVTVALSGDGGDELFAGYDRYIASKLNNKYTKIPFFIRNGVSHLTRSVKPSAQKKGVTNMVKRFIEGSDLPEEGRHMRWQYFLDAHDKRGLYSDFLFRETGHLNPFDYINYYYNSLNTTDQLAREQYVDLKNYLADAMLVKIDRMSMANSLEVRVPFLDHRFVEFSFTIPSDLKLKGFTSKYVLKKAASSVLPKDIIQKQKQGFSIPVKNWLRNEIKDYVESILFTNPEAMKYFNTEYVEKLIHEHKRNTKDNSHKLWILLNFVLWHKNYMEE